MRVSRSLRSCCPPLLKTRSKTASLRRRRGSRPFPPPTSTHATAPCPGFARTSREARGSRRTRRVPSRDRAASGDEVDLHHSRHGPAQAVVDAGQNVREGDSPLRRRVHQQEWNRNREEPARHFSQVRNERMCSEETGFPVGRDRARGRSVRGGTQDGEDASD
jgi:hypothetical protein